MKRKLIPIALLAALILVPAFVTLGWQNGATNAIAASRTVEATEADLGFQVAGRIESIAAREGVAVAQAAVLARLEQTELSARRAAAEAQLTSARALLTEMQRGARPEELQQA